MAVSTFGDVALAPSNPDIVYAGTGEQNNRQSTSYGNGVYRTDDGGATWRYLGLAETRHIGRIVVDPERPRRRAYVAALGNLWAPSAERGVFRTSDGGRTWEKVLFVDENTGRGGPGAWIPTTPGPCYAATYQRMRRAWGFNGGGPGSGIYKTTNGGNDWAELTGRHPEPATRAASAWPSRAPNPRVLDGPRRDGRPGHAGHLPLGGRRAPRWTRVSPMDGRPMYYSHIFIDPNDANRGLHAGHQLLRQRRRRPELDGDRRAAHVRRGRPLRPPRAVDRPLRPGAPLPGRATAASGSPTTAAPPSGR